MLEQSFGKIFQTFSDGNRLVTDRIG